jgi:spore coat polysaccharide biosynthesis protein SpsF (cytidylyltransferase family)
MLEHVLRRALAVPGVAAVVLATSVNERDAPLAELAWRLGCGVIRGSEHDVLGRFAAAQQALRVERVMRITGDCPLLCVDVCEATLRAALESGYDFVTNDTDQSGYPDGTDCEVITAWALAQADRYATTASDREHVTRWIRRHVPSRVAMAPEGSRCPLAWKWSVDDGADLARVRRIFGALRGSGGYTLGSAADACRRVEQEDSHAYTDHRGDGLHARA